MIPIPVETVEVLQEEVIEMPVENNEQEELILPTPSEQEIVAPIKSKPRNEDKYKVYYRDGQATDNCLVANSAKRVCDEIRFYDSLVLYVITIRFYDSIMNFVYLRYYYIMFFP